MFSFFNKPAGFPRNLDQSAKTLIDINRGILETKSHPAASEISELFFFKEALQSIGSRADYYQQDFRVFYGFFSLMFRMKYCDELDTDIETHHNIKHIWSPIITSWLAAALLIRGDISRSNFPTELTQSCGYHGILSEHNVEDCLRFHLRLKSEQPSLEIPALLNDFVERYDIESFHSIDTPKFLDNLFDFVSAKIKDDSRYKGLLQ